MAAALTACAGFLLAVLWIDLMFDSLGGAARRPPTEDALAAIAAYYHRATTTSQPRGALIAVVMATLLALLGVAAARDGHPGWLLATSAALAGAAITLAAVRTVPRAVRLGRRVDDLAGQRRLARSIYRDHLLCAAAMTGFLVLWLGEAVR